MLPIYENQFARMRDARMEDAAELLAISSDAAVMQYYGENPVHDLASAKMEIEWFLGLPLEQKGARWVIADRASDEYIGDAGIYNYSRAHRRIEIGFKLKKEYWRKGIITFCIQHVLHYGFSTLNCNRIEALVDKRNIGSIKSLERCGFKRDGLLREYELEQDGFVDLWMFSQLAREFASAT